MNDVKKILVLFMLAGIISSCHPKRMPSKGCDCPGGGHGMLKVKNINESTASIYPKSGSKPS